MLRGLLGIVFLRHVFQFEDVAVVGLVVGEIGQKEEVAIAVCHLYLRGGVIIVVEIEICKEESLYVALSLYTVAHRRKVFVAVGHILETFSPVAIKCHHVEKVS